MFYCYLPRNTTEHVIFVAIQALIIQVKPIFFVKAQFGKAQDQYGKKHSEVELLNSIVVADSSKNFFQS